MINVSWSVKYARKCIMYGFYVRWISHHSSPNPAFVACYLWKTIHNAYHLSIFQDFLTWYSKLKMAASKNIAYVHSLIFTNMELKMEPNWQLMAIFIIKWSNDIFQYGLLTISHIVVITCFYHHILHVYLISLMCYERNGVCCDDNCKNNDNCKNDDNCKQIIIILTTTVKKSTTTVKKEIWRQL